jgi:NTE family protein
MKKALVLSGGGGLGAYQVGALQFMLGVLKRPYNIIVGTSVGCINGAEVAMWPIGKEVEAAESLWDLWENLQSKDVVDPHFLQPLALLWEPSTHTFVPLKQLLNRRIDMERMRDSGRTFRAVAVDCITGEFVLYGEDCVKPQLVRGMLASSATPILHPPRVTDVQFLYDGGIRDVSPIRQAIQLGADEIDLVLCQSPKLGPWNPDPNRVWNTAPRVFDIMFRELVEGDLDRTEDKNALVEARHPRGVGKRIVKLRVIRPAEPLPGDAAKFEPEQTKRMAEIGRRDAENHRGW